MFAYFVLTVACQKDPIVYPAGSDEAINQWIYTEMTQYYYWSDQLPSRPSYQRTPTDFYYGLLNQEDRFSAIVQSLRVETEGKTLANTFGIDFINVLQGDQSFHVISQVVPSSSGAIAGLVRGDTIQQMNETVLNTANTAATVASSLTQNSLRLTLKNGKTFHLPAGFIAQPVVYMAAIVDDRPNTAYLYLSNFDFSGGYDLLATLAQFKAAEVQHLVLDLRYNPGGQVSFAAFCALLLAPVQADDIFVRYRGNNHLPALNETFANALARQPDGYTFTAGELIAARPNLKKLYILTTGHTASAAEMLINNLNPYLDIIQLGETTLGKDMASLTRTTPEHISGDNPSWHILPLVYKMLNSEHAGNYQNGIVPQQIIREYETLPLYPFGDTRDPLVAAALTAGNSTTQQARATGNNKPTEKAHLKFESRPYEHKIILLEDEQ